jgi:uncharacterized protein with NRDE domain
MCLLVFNLGEDGRFRVMAVRDEFLSRRTAPTGRWWDDLGAPLIGAKDLAAGGTNLAVNADTGALAVLVNGPGEAVGTPKSRGWLALRALNGDPIDSSEFPQLPGFFLLEADETGARVTEWDGTSATRTEIEPGWHTLSRGGLDASVDEREIGLLDWVAETAPTTWSDESWKQVAEKIILEPVPLEGQEFGSVQLNFVDTADLTFWTKYLKPASSWQPILEPAQ